MGQHQPGRRRDCHRRRLHAAISDVVQPVARELVALELARLDPWQVTLEARMDDGEPPERIVPVCLRVSERRAKLLGLDAPARARRTERRNRAGGGGGRAARGAASRGGPPASGRRRRGRATSGRLRTAPGAARLIAESAAQDFTAAPTTAGRAKFVDPSGCS